MNEKELAKTPDAPAGTLYTIRVNTGEKVLCAHLKEPSTDSIEIAQGLVMGLMKEPQYIAAGEVIIRDAWLGGDAVLKDRETREGRSAMMTAFGIIKSYDTELIELKKS